MEHNSDKMISVLQEESKQYGIIITDEMCVQIHQYCEHMLEFNRTVNLTRITEPVEIAIKHILDSLLIYDSKLFPSQTKIADIGTGAGFPGVPLAIFLKDSFVTLVDSLRKRTLFLSEATAAAGINNVEIVQARAEDFAQMPRYREKYDIVTARAVAPLNILAELCIPVIRVGGTFLVMKGPSIENEITEALSAINLAGGKIHSVKEYQLPRTNDRRTLIKIKKTRPTPGKYPRKAGIPQKQPL